MTRWSGSGRNGTSQWRRLHEKASQCFRQSPRVRKTARARPLPTDWTSIWTIDGKCKVEDLRGRVNASVGSGARLASDLHFSSPSHSLSRIWPTRYRCGPLAPALRPRGGPGGHPVSAWPITRTIRVMHAYLSRTGEKPAYRLLIACRRKTSDASGSFSAAAAWPDSAADNAAAVHRPSTRSLSPVVVKFHSTW